MLILISLIRIRTQWRRQLILHNSSLCHELVTNGNTKNSRCRVSWYGWPLPQTCPERRWTKNLSTVAIEQQIKLMSASLNHWASLSWLSRNNEGTLYYMNPLNNMKMIFFKLLVTITGNNYWSLSMSPLSSISTVMVRLLIDSRPPHSALCSKPCSSFSNSSFSLRGTRQMVRHPSLTLQYRVTLSFNGGDTNGCIMSLSLLGTKDAIWLVDGGVCESWVHISVWLSDLICLDHWTSLSNCPVFHVFNFSIYTCHFLYYLQSESWTPCIQLLRY